MEGAVPRPEQCDEAVGASTLQPVFANDFMMPVGPRRPPSSEVE